MAFGVAAYLLERANITSFWSRAKIVLSLMIAGSVGAASLAPHPKC
jgi:hypothetical protein